MQCDGVQPAFILRRSPFENDHVSAGLGHSVSDVERERVEVVNEQDGAGWRLISQLFQFQNSAAGSTTCCLTRRLKRMNPEGSAWQCRVFLAHPTRCNAKCCTLPSRLLNLSFGLRSDGDAAAGTDRCLPSAAHLMGLKGSNEDVPCALTAVHIDVADGPGPEGTRPLLQLIDDGANHGTWASRDGTTGEDGAQRFSPSKGWFQGSCDVAHEMLNVGIGFDVKSLHVDAAGFGHLCEVVAHQVHQHPMLGSLFLVADHGFSKLGGFLSRAPLRTGAFDRGGLQDSVPYNKQGFWRRTCQCQSEIMSMDIGRERGRVVLHQALKNGIGVVDFALPVFPNVDLVDLPVNNALTDGLHVVRMRLVGVRDRFSVGRWRWDTNAVAQFQLKV